MCSRLQHQIRTQKKVISLDDIILVGYYVDYDKRL